MIDLSIIIPVYNTEKYLEKCLQNILNIDDINKFEVLVIDDCSDGNCSKIVEKYLKRLNLVYIKHNKNRGLFQSRLTGILNSKGTYIAHLDPDDIIANHIYSNCVNKAHNEFLDIVIFNVSQINECNYEWIEINNYINIDYSKVTGEYVLTEIFGSNSRNWIWHVSWNKIIRKDILLKSCHIFNTNYHINMYEDLLYSFIIFTHLYNTPTIGIVRDLGIKYFRNVDSITLKKNTLDNFMKKIGDTHQVLTLIKNILIHYNLISKHKISFIELKDSINKIYNPHSILISNISEKTIIDSLILKYTNYHGILLSQEEIAEKVLNLIESKNIKHLSIFGVNPLADNIFNRLCLKNIKVDYFINYNMNNLERTYSNTSLINALEINKYNIQTIYIASYLSCKEIAFTLNKITNSSVNILYI